MSFRKARHLGRAGICFALAAAAMMVLAFAVPAAAETTEGVTEAVSETATAPVEATEAAPVEAPEPAGVEAEAEPAPIEASDPAPVEAPEPEAPVTESVDVTSTAAAAAESVQSEVAEGGGNAVPPTPVDTSRTASVVKRIEDSTVYPDTVRSLDRTTSGLIAPVVERVRIDTPLTDAVAPLLVPTTPIVREALDLVTATVGAVPPSLLLGPPPSAIAPVAPVAFDGVPHQESTARPIGAGPTGSIDGVGSTPLAVDGATAGRIGSTRPTATGQSAGALGAAGEGTPKNFPPDRTPPPLRAPGVGPTSGGSNFVPLVALLALLALAPPASLRRRRSVPDCQAPTPFVCALECPG
jgi:hypothetical protein